MDYVARLPFQSDRQLTPSISHIRHALSIQNFPLTISHCKSMLKKLAVPKTDPARELERVTMLCDIYEYMAEACIGEGTPEKATEWLEKGAPRAVATLGRMPCY